MSKKLNEMSLEELWEIFPIFLVEHNDEWKTWYEDEKLNILSLIPSEKIYRISHIGSTYIPTIWAKNIVDILLEIKNNEDLKFVKEILLKNILRLQRKNIEKDINLSIDFFKFLVYNFI